MTKTESALSRWSLLKQYRARGIEPDSLRGERNSPDEGPADLNAAAPAATHTTSPLICRRYSRENFASRRREGLNQNVHHPWSEEFLEQARGDWPVIRPARQPPDEEGSAINAGNVNARSL